MLSTGLLELWTKSKWNVFGMQPSSLLRLVLPAQRLGATPPGVRTERFSIRGVTGRYFRHQVSASSADPLNGQHQLIQLVVFSILAHQPNLIRHQWNRSRKVTEQVAEAQKEILMLVNWSAPHLASQILKTIPKKKLTRSRRMEIPECTICSLALKLGSQSKILKKKNIKHRYVK